MQNLNQNLILIINKIRLSLRRFFCRRQLSDWHRISHGIVYFASLNGILCRLITNHEISTRFSIIRFFTSIITLLFKTSLFSEQLTITY